MPSDSSRSSSISSTSSSNWKSPEAGAKKKFCCTFPTCGKSFSRSEHLHRHALNHKDGNNTCLRCSAHFRRRDLLDRHMARHKEKDDEAGGEGLGLLATRKRLWRDAQGNIVNARRPSSSQEGAKRRQITRADGKYATTTPSEDRNARRSQISMALVPSQSHPMSRMSSGSCSTIIVDSGASLYADREQEAEIECLQQDPHQDSWLELNALPSPPMSGGSLHSAADSPSGELDSLYQEASWQPLLSGLPQICGDESPELPSTESSMFGGSSWGSGAGGGPAFQTFMGAMAELPYEDIFKPEASMYEWQAWNSQVLMSRCREEKYDPQEERKLDWGTPYPGQEGFRRAFGLGAC